MKKTLLIFTILFCCAFITFAQKDSIVQEKAETEEYSVYKAVLKELFIKPNTKQLVIRKLTINEPYKTFYNFRNKPINQEMIENFSSANLKQAELKDDFGVDIPVSLVTEEELRAIFDTYYADITGKIYEEVMKKKYNTSRIVWFSRVGFNKDKNQAMLHVGYSCGATCGQGLFVFLSKRDGNWIILDKLPTWIS